MERELYWVSCDIDNTGIGPTRGDVLVIAEGPHDALDKAPEHPDANRLWDEEIQRGKADGEEYSRMYDRIVVEPATYVGDL